MHHDALMTVTAGPLERRVSMALLGRSVLTVGEAVMVDIAGCDEIIK